MNILLLKNISNNKRKLPRNVKCISSSGHLLLLGKTSKKWKILLVRGFSVLLKTNINYDHTVTSNWKKNDPLLSCIESFLFLLVFDSDSTCMKSLMRFIGKQGKWKKTIFFFISTELRAEQRHEYFSSDVHVWLNLICCQPFSIILSFTETNKESSVLLGLSCQGVKSYV